MSSGYSGPVVTDTTAYVLAVVITQHALYEKNVGDDLLPCLVTDEMADCIVQLHCMTGCHASAGFYSKSKKLVYDQEVKSPVA